MKLSILGIFAHPDDAELVCSGTLLLHKALGYQVGIVDLTKGELGTRGTAETRKAEAETASKILNLDIRQNLALPDGFFENTPKHQLPVIQAIRTFQPEIVITNAPQDRHPDHGRASQLVTEACFLAGLSKIQIQDKHGQPLSAWRPKALYYSVQDRWLMPNLVVDISPYWQRKMEAILAYKTQFYSPESHSQEPQTYISTPDFLTFLEARAREMGHLIGVKYGEGFIKTNTIGIKNLFDII
ncbi:MAG: bacillithiol biosynthesis deacetylase BshB1 [Microscillaceae bacterium]|nr:bacillithiol biosynthesis deacetylase BshB1 [Microscillaceae bacterium]MDW8461028.1 bacillithiol biosynthesis deacetylase BshB1 [Cytophagales bacterium]